LVGLVLIVKRVNLRRLKMIDYKNVYSIYKPVHFPEKIEALRRGELIVPTHVQLDLTGKCNYNCHVCFYRNAGFKHLEFVPYEEIKVDRALRLIDEFGEIGIPAIELTGGGEPLMYPAIKQVLKKIAKNKMELALVTNGSLLNEEILSYIENPAWIRFSIDSATPETYEKYHQVPKKYFNIVLKNLERVVNSGFKNCIIGVSFVISPLNYHEIAAAAALFKSIGVDNIRYSFAYTSKYDKLLTEEQKEEAFRQMDIAKSFEDNDFKVFAMKERIIDFGKPNYDFSYCGYQRFTFQIGCDGRCYPCCILKYYPKYSFGNIYEKPLKEILFGEDRKKYLDNFDVTKCLPCWLRHRNKVIEGLVFNRIEELLTKEQYEEFLEYSKIPKEKCLHLNFI